MENKSVAIIAKKSIQPFEITQALVGLELGKTDESILRYFDFFTQNIPTAAAYFLHVEPNFDSFNIFMGQEFTDMRLDFLETKVNTQLKKGVEKYFSKKENTAVEYDFREGKPLRELLRSAEDLKADLIVIGQKAGTKHHGILAKKFARKAIGNALMIPENSEAQIKRILVPIDFSENSGRALQTAISLNKQLKSSAKIIAYHVYKIPTMSNYKISRSRSQIQTIVEEKLKTTAAEFLEKYIPSEKSEVELNLQHREMSNYATSIYAFATKENADFIVMGAKGHSKIGLLLIGSVTEKLMSENDTIPTLIVK